MIEIIKDNKTVKAKPSELREGQRVRINVGKSKMLALVVRVVPPKTV